jgi:hypothetical protein
VDVDAEQLIADLEALLQRAARSRSASPPAVPLEEWAARHGLGR